jgi:predicted AAA+ superfamily ATPase
MQQNEIIELIQGELWQRLETLPLVPRTQAIKPVSGKAMVLIGMRRVGKTSCLLSYLKKLAEQGVPRSSVLFLNLEDDRVQITNALQLTKLIDQFYSKNPANYSRQTYILLDEVQAIAGWEKVARRLVETDRCELWLTGSSAKMLSKEVATVFRGRSIAHETWPYDFSEYLTAKKLPSIDPTLSFANRDLARQQLESFLFTGGFPEVVKEESSETRRQILNDYKSVVILRDIVERHRITNFVALEQLVNAVISNSGNLLSVNKLCGDFKSRGIPIGRDTLFEYLEYLEDVYLAFLVPIYNQSLRIRSTTPKKCFCIDTGMVANYLVRNRADIGRLFETLVFIDLKRRGFRIFYYRTKSGAEVDFVVAGENGDPLIIQVCFDISDDQTRQREERTLSEAIKELKCKGILLTPYEYTKGYPWLDMVI